MFKAQRTVWQRLAASTEGIQHAGVDQRAGKRHTVELDGCLCPIQHNPLCHSTRQLQLDIRVRQHRRHHGAVSGLWHRLERVGKVAVVATDHHGYPRRHLGGDLLGRYPPLFDERLLVDELRQLTEQRVHLLAQRQNRHPGAVTEAAAQGRDHRFCLVGRETALDAGQVERQRHQLAINARQHPMLVAMPLGEFRQVVGHRRLVGVEQMGAVAVDQHPGTIEFIKTVSGQMVTLFEDQYTPAQLTGHAFGHHGTRQAGANHDRLISHTVSPNKRCPTWAGSCRHSQANWWRSSKNQPGASVATSATDCSIRRVKRWLSP